VWQAAEKIVYSTTREASSTANTQIERHFDAGSVRSMKAAAGRDLMVGGANLAAQAFDAGLVDECHFFIGPVVLGRGKPALPSGGRVDLELLDQRRFDNGYASFATGGTLAGQPACWQCLGGRDSLTQTSWYMWFIYRWHPGPLVGPPSGVRHRTGLRITLFRSRPHVGRPPPLFQAAFPYTPLFCT
jgi:hypothetical protein